MTFRPLLDLPGRHIGPGQPCFVIAEAGSNHGKSLATAIALIDAAADAGADAVKFQSFTADQIAADTSHPIARLRDRFGEFGATLRQFYANAELPAGWVRDLFAYARERGIRPMSTPFDERSVDELVGLGMEAIKIASFELVHLPLLRHAASTGLPLILSTGMANLGEIEEALEVVSAAGATQVALLHCNIEYPPAFDDIELRAIETMRQAFSVPVGFSDHTTGIHIPVAAVALGACVIEKHYTLSRAGDGPDHGFALEPAELASMVSAIRDVERSLGSGRKRRVAAEEIHHQRGRRSLFAARDIPAGTVITRDMISVLRPGVGLHPRYLDHIVGRTAREAIASQSPLEWSTFFGP